MIKIALKHWIYEKCINVLFNAISRNFFVPNKQLQLKEGEFYHSLYVKKSGYFTYYDCKIIIADNVNNYIEFDSKSFVDWGKEGYTDAIMGIMMLATRQGIHRTDILEIHY